MSKLLVTGASGFLGWHVCQSAQSQWQVFGTYQSKTAVIPGATTLKADISDFTALQQLFETVQPDAVIHLAAQSSPNYCQQYPDEAHAINVTAAANIAGLCSDRDIPCAFTSTDLVFDGQNPPYRETDPVCPINLYGEQKVLAEEAMQSRYPKTAICRMPLMFGEASPTAHSFIQPFLQILRQKQELRLFMDEFRTPASATSAAQGLLLALEKVQGCIHLGGKERISRYEFGRLMVEVLGLSDTHLQACRQQDVPMSAPRPADVSLDSFRAFSLGYEPLTIREELAALRGKV